MNFNLTDLSLYKAKITRVEKEALDLLIKSEEDLVRATDTLSKIKTVAKDIEGFKKGITDPINLALKNTRSLFYPLEEGWANAEMVVKQKMIDYRQAAERKRVEEEAKLLKKIEEGKISVEKAAMKLETIPLVEKKIEGKKGEINFKKVWKYEVLDYTLLPMKYLQANSGAIWADVRSGQVTEISGVKIWSEEIVAGSTF